MANQDTRPPAESRVRAAHFVRTVLTILLFAAAFCVVQRLTFTLRFPPVQENELETVGAEAWREAAGAVVTSSDPSPSRRPP